MSCSRLLQIGGVNLASPGGATHQRQDTGGVCKAQGTARCHPVPLFYYKRGQQRSRGRLIDLLRPVNTFFQLTKGPFVQILQTCDSSVIRYLLESSICSVTHIFYGVLTGLRCCVNAAISILTSAVGFFSCATVRTDLEVVKERESGTSTCSICLIFQVTAPQTDRQRGQRVPLCYFMALFCSVRTKNN